MLRPSWTTTALCALTLAGCTEEVTAEDVSKRTSAIVSDVAAAAIANVSQLADHPGLVAITDALERLSSLEILPGARELGEATSDDSAYAPAEEEYVPSDAPPPPYDVPPYAEESYGDSGLDTMPSEAEMRAQVNEWLSTRVFTESNLESSDEESATFLLRGAVVCAEMDDGGECAARVDAAEVRVRAEVDGGDVTLTIKVGPARATLLVLELAEGSVAFEVDLAELKAALTHLASVAGEDIALPEIMEGGLRAALLAPSEQSVELHVGVTHDLHVAVTADLGAFDVRIAASPSLFEVFADAASGSFAMGLDANAVAIELPWAEAVDGATSAGTLAVRAGGAALQVTAQSGSDVVEVSAALPGPVDGGAHAVEVSKDGALLFSADLNADAGRAMSMTVTAQGEDAALLSFAPGVDLVLGYHLASVAAELGTPSHLDDETYRLQLVGDAPALRVGSDPMSGEGVLAVESGELRLSSSASDVVISAHADECLAGEEAAVDEHPILGSLSVSACAP